MTNVQLAVDGVLVADGQNGDQVFEINIKTGCFAILH